MQTHPAYKHHVIPVINAQSPNMSVPFDRFHLSFLPSVADYGSVTTALVLDGRVFFVLNGDHHKQMHDCAVRGGLQACVDYFIEHIGEVNGMSEHLSVVGLRADPFELTQTALDVIGLVNLGAIRGAVATATDQF